MIVLLLIFGCAFGPCLGTDALSEVIEGELLEAGSIEHTGSDWIHLSMALTLMSNKSSLSDNLKKNFKVFTESLFNSSTGSPLHLIFLTDAAAKPFIMHTLSAEIGGLLSKYVFHKETRDRLNNYGWKFPRLKVEYVDFHAFVADSHDLIDEMKDIYCTGENREVELEDEEHYFDFVIHCMEKYRLDFFYLVPLYHRYYPASLDRLIVLDVDLAFRVDVGDLQAQFDLMDDTQLFGASKDFGFHYPIITQSYRKARNISFGESGFNYALNSGVLLLDLGKLRDSSETDRLFSVQYSKELVKKYDFLGITGDQDMLNLLRWELPHLFHYMPCAYNNQRAALWTEKPDDPEYRDLYSLAAPSLPHGVDLRDCSEIKIQHRIGTNF